MARDIKIGLIARADRGGLGAQTYDFYKHMKPFKTLLVDIQHLNGYPIDASMYPGALTVQGMNVRDEYIRAFLGGLDVVFTVETPYNYNLYTIAREMGVKTVCQYNWEWFDNHSINFPLPDLLLAPSKWGIDMMAGYGVPIQYLDVPVDRVKFPVHLNKREKKPQVFLHVVGHPTYNDRNGTIMLLEALPYIQSGVNIVIRTQGQELPRPYTDHRLTIIKEDVIDRADLYQGADVLVLPRRYGGLSLQINEAMSCGLPVISLDIDPNNTWLPQEWLVKAHFKENFQIKTTIESYECTPQDLARKIDDMAGDSLLPGQMMADAISTTKDWKVMKDKYLTVFYALIDNLYTV